MNMAITVQADVGTILTRWANYERRARLVIDGCLSIKWINTSAENFLIKERGVFQRNGRLTLRNPRAERDFREFINNATTNLSAFCLGLGESGEHIVITAVRLDGDEKNLIGLTLHCSGADFDMELADLRQAFGLTASEAAIAKRLHNGQTADEAADQLAVSIDTVRTHIKKVYAKLNVSSREAFFRKLAPYTIPPACFALASYPYIPHAIKLLFGATGIV